MTFRRGTPPGLVAGSLRVTGDLNVAGVIRDAAGRPVTGDVTFAGLELFGTYRPAAPISHYVVRLRGTSEATAGLTSLVTLPATATAILAFTLAHMTPGGLVILRTDIGLTATTMQFQTRSPTTPFAAVATTAYDFFADISYQV